MFWKKKDDMISKAKRANEVLLSLGIQTHTESGKQLRSAIAMELLGESYDVMDKRSKADFVKQNQNVLGAVKNMLIEEGVLTNPGQQVEYVVPKRKQKR